MTASADILIIGGGVIGSSIAFNLLQDGFKGRILVIERDPSYQFASSALAMGGVRQQFMSTVNIRMVQYSLKVLEHFPESQFRQRGYLFLATESNCEKLRRRHEVLMKSVEIATKSQTGELIRICLCDHNLVVRRTAPMDSTGIDHDRKFVGPWSRQCAPE